MADIEVCDIDSMKPKYKGRTEWRYDCPFCEEKRGKTDTDAKFYFNIVKRVGHCFKCHSVIYPDRVNDVEAEKTELSVNCAKFLETVGNTDKLDLIMEPQEITFYFDALTDEDMSYLQGRNPFLPLLSPYIGFGAWHGKDHGVVTPFWYKGKIVKFQTRFHKRENWNKGKYYTQEGPKPFYSPTRILETFPMEDPPYTLTLCEGVFDAIALAIMGFPHPLAILGDELTALHYKILRNLIPSRIIVSMDDEKRSKDVQRTIQCTIPSIEQVDIHCEWGGTATQKEDPESYLVNQLKKNDIHFHQQCIQNIARLMGDA